MTKKSNTTQKKKYIMKTSESEVYRQECYLELVVEDYSGIVQKEGVLKAMYEALSNYTLQNFVALNFDSTVFETDIRFKTRGIATYAKVVIKQKSWFKRLLETFN